IVPPANGHVVRHEVEKEPEVAITKRVGQSLECCLTTQFSIDTAMIQHIVAVCASFHGLEHGRTVQMADSKLSQILGNGGRVVERKTAAHLKPIRGDFIPQGKSPPG